MKTKALLILLLFATSCAEKPAAEKPAETKPAPPPSVVDVEAIKTHIQKLSSDEMEGRAPGGKGEELATSYIADYYKSIGLKTQFQAVPMVGITSTSSPLKLTGKGGTKMLKYGDEFVAWSKREQEMISTNADLVFCGY